MEASLTITTPESAHRREVRLDPGDLSVGRSSRCDIRIPTRSVSGHHLTLHGANGSWAVVDEHSTNGTTLNGKRLPPGEQRSLSAGDVIELAEVELSFDTVRSQDVLSLEETGTLARQLVGDLLLGGSDDDMARLEVNGPDTETVTPLEDSLDRAFIGRDDGCLISLERVDAPRLLEVSRVHDGFGIRPVDVTGADDVRLNGSTLTSKTSLSDGDVLTAGPYTITFYDPLESLLDDLEDEAPGSPQDTSPPADASDDMLERDVDVDSQAFDEVAGADAADTQPPEASEPPRAGLSPTEWIVLVVAVVLMLGAGVLLLTVFEVL
jgi:pSer/pThr/pTyr-binding forkhead associated (FHA) protein